MTAPFQLPIQKWNGDLRDERGELIATLHNCTLEEERYIVNAINSHGKLREALGQLLLTPAMSPVQILALATEALNTTQ